MKLRTTVLPWVLSGVFGFLAPAIAVNPTPAFGDVITLNAIDSGWYTNFGQHVTDNQNYLLGTTTGSLPTYNNFFAFDFSSVTGIISSAILEAYNPAVSTAGDVNDGYMSVDATETIEFYSLETSLANIIGGTGGVSAFNDFADGTLYGSYLASSADNGGIVSIALSGCHKRFQECD